MWERPGNVPPLVRLLCAYAAKGKALVLDKVQMVLGVFQKLLSRGATDQHAARLLSALWRACELAELQQYATPIFNLCIQRAQGYKKVGPSLVSTWSVFLARYGPRALWQQLESIQPGLALGALGVQSVTAHPGPGSSEAHPAGRMIGIGLRAREP